MTLKGQGQAEKDAQITKVILYMDTKRPRTLFDWRD